MRTFFLRMFFGRAAMRLLTSIVEYEHERLKCVVYGYSVYGCSMPPCLDIDVERMYTSFVKAGFLPDGLFPAPEAQQEVQE